MVKHSNDSDLRCLFGGDQTESATKPFHISEVEHEGFGGAATAMTWQLINSASRRPGN